MQNPLELNWQNTSLKDAKAIREQCSNILRRRRSIQGDVGVRILDYGTGVKGVMRTVLQWEMKPEDTLLLYDPFAPIQPPSRENVRILPADARPDEPVDLLTMSHVLPYIEPDGARELLSTFRDTRPQTQLIVVDYTLKGRDREKILGMMDSAAEAEWLRKLGPDEFIRTHTRYTLEQLIQLFQESGYANANATPLPSGNRAMVVAGHDPYHTLDTDTQQCIDMDELNELFGD